SPVSPSSRTTSTCWAAVRPELQTFWLVYVQLPALKSPAVHATGRCEPYCGTAVYQATHSSVPHGKISSLLAEVWISGVPFWAWQSSTRAQTLVMPPLRLATATAPERLTEVREGEPF